MSDLFEKSKRILILVESPEKSRTITKIFRDAGYSNVYIMATIGHFTEIANGSGYWNTGIDVENNFEANYKISDKKKDNVQKLKEQVKAADFVYICTDGDREGEAIGWSAVKFLKIPAKKYKRATYHEINQRAVFEAIQKAGEINQNLVDAAHSRSFLDKGLGYRLSPVARQNVQCKSVGRCQSPALQILVFREREIINFKPEKYFDLFLNFSKNLTEFKAKYVGTDDKPIKRLNSQEECDTVINDCKGNPFIVRNIEHKNRNENPKPPFCTATFLQECAQKLGLTAKIANSCAQHLFETGKISYHRTDDETMSPEFEAELKAFVLSNFGKEYSSGIVQKGKKDSSDQNGHECLRILDLNMTPEKYAQITTNDLEAKVYRIIYNRTVASAMSAAVIAVTTYNIYNVNHKFILNSNELKFDGFKKLYMYKAEDEEDDEIVKESFNENEILTNCNLKAIAKETQPPARYTEASFLKELKDVGIGRPSTYQSIVDTVKDTERGYIEIVDKKYFKPTEKGMQLISFLEEKFSDLINIDYTKDMEKDLDLIANGKLDYLKFLKDFFNHLEEVASKVPYKAYGGYSKGGKAKAEVTDKMCPECGKPLLLRNGRYGPFLGCSGFPKCKHIEKVTAGK